jgi:hypothetical protein
MVIFGDYYGRCPKSFGHSHIIRIFLSWNPGFFGFNILRKPQVCENMCIEPISAWHLNNITNEKKTQWQEGIGMESHQIEPVQMQRQPGKTLNFLQTCGFNL